MAIIPGLEKYKRLLLRQTSQLWISSSTALATSGLCSYYIRISLLIREVSGQRGGINEGYLQSFDLLGLTALSI